MGKQAAGRPIPRVPAGKRPARPVARGAHVDGKPVSPAVARARGSAAAGQGHGGGQGGGGGGK